MSMDVIFWVAVAVGIAMFCIQLCLCASKVRWIVKLIPLMGSFVLLGPSALGFLITIGATDLMNIAGGVLISAAAALVMVLLAWILFGIVYGIIRLIKKVCRCK